MNPERLFRRQLLGREQRARVYAAPGIEGALARELELLLPSCLTPSKREPRLRLERQGVSIEGASYRTLLELTMRLNTAHDLTLLLEEGRVRNRLELDRFLERPPWELFFHAGDTTSLRVDSEASALYHKGLVRERAAERLARCGVSLLPAGDSPHRLSLLISHDVARLEISLAGAPLWRRGYRGSTNAVAPLREDLAAGAIRLALAEASNREASASPALLLPFAGSGTLLFEYLLAYFTIPPFIFRESYAFENFACGAPPSVSWVKGKLREELSARLRGAPPALACLVERSAPAATAAAANLEAFSAKIALALDSAGRAEPLPLELEQITSDAFARPWRKWLPAEITSVFLPLNPPYGLRLATRSQQELFRRIGRSCRELAVELSPGGLAGFILCPSESSWRVFRREIGGAVGVTSHIMHGGRDIRLCRFAS